MRQTDYLSSTNAIVYFSGHEVGHLQSLSIREDYSLQRVNSFWRNEPIGFVPGVYNFSATASKAFIEYESVLGNIQDIVKTADSVINNPLGIVTAGAVSTIISGLLKSSTGQSNSWVNGGNSFDMSGGYEAVSNFTNNILPPMTSIFKRILSGVASIGEIFSNLAFEIRVKNPILNIDTSQSNLAPILQQDLWVLRGCQLATRDIEISVGNVVIMENVTIMATSNYDGLTTSISPGVIPFQ